MSIDENIKQANERLKAANVRLAIEREGTKLRLRGTLPSRSGVGEKQQRISLNISATLEGVEQCEREAHNIRHDLNIQQFDWDKFTGQKKLQTISQWLLDFEVDYFKSRKKTEQSLTTWKTDYVQAFKKLPSKQPLTEAVLRETILTTEPDSKTRKRFCICLGALAKFAGLDCDFKNLAGRYSFKAVNPRDVPDDAIIAKSYYQIKNSNWQWVYGVLATYGLRNHEVFRVDFDLLRSGCRILHVLEGKTGARRVWACYPEWFDEFNLSVVLLPDCNLKRNNSALGHEVTQAFSRQSVPFSPYDLRHAWAIRTLEFGLDISLSAQQMGHKLKVHCESYHHWISDKHHQKAYDLLMLRGDRPKPPKLT